MDPTIKLPNKGYKENNTEQDPSIPTLPINSGINIGKDIMTQNDSKLLSEKPFNELISNFSIQGENKEKHPHLIKFYELGKIYLTYFESNNPTQPHTLEAPYSDFTKQVATLIYCKNLKRDPSGQSKVDLYVNQNGIKYVLKSYWYTCIPDYDEIEEFISCRYQEFKLLQIYSACPHSASPIDMHFVYLKNTNLIISELLQSYGGEPISKLFPCSDSKVVLNILFQITSALKYLECYKIEHNDIKEGNVLVEINTVLKQPIIKLIDLDIGRNQSFTVASPLRTKHTGFSQIYVAPEILKIEKDRGNAPKYDPRKAQIYSMGILMLQLIGFFPCKMNTTKLDQFKDSEEKYSIFMDTLKKFIKEKESDILMGKICKLIKICVEYSPDKRLVANQFLNIVEVLETKKVSQLIEMYENMIKEIPITDSENYMEHVNSKSLIEQINKQKSQIDELTNQNNKLLEENKEQRQVIQDLQTKNQDLKQSLDNTSLKSENIIKEMVSKIANVELQKQEEECLKIKTTNNLESKITIFESKIVDQEKEILQIKGEKNQLIKENEMLMKENQEITNHLKENDKKMGNYQSRIKELETFENLSKENSSRFDTLKRKLEYHKMFDFAIYNCYPPLAAELFKRILELSAKVKILESKYVEKKTFDENSFYSGPLNEKGLPHGVGTLIFKEPYRQFIGEFESGKSKNNLGFMVDESETFYFGTIENGICQNISLILPNFSKNLGKTYYFGETKENQFHGKGKIEYLDETSFEGYFKNGKREGKGKYVHSKDLYYEGEYKNGLREGYGKNVYSKNEFYEGEFKNDKKEGIGKDIYSNDVYYEGEYKNDKKEGYGKYVDSNDQYYYEGEYKNGKKEGKGKEVYYTDEYYEGEYKNGEKEGIGKYVFSKDKYYEGEFKTGKFDGKGKSVYSKDEYYEGEFKYGLKEGKGKYVYSKDEYYEGEFKIDKCEGKGKHFKLKSGQLKEIQEGCWLNDQRQGKFLITDSKNQTSYRAYKNNIEKSCVIF